MMWNYGYGCGPMMGWGGLGWIFWIFWLFLIVFIIAGLVRWVARGSRRHWHEDNNKAALDILRERYVKGEIDKKEFEEKKKDLT